MYQTFTVQCTSGGSAHRDADVVRVRPFLVLFVESNTCVDDLVHSLECVLDSVVGSRRADEIGEESRVEDDDVETTLARHVHELARLHGHGG